MAFVVFWGTFWPLIAEALTGTRRALGPPWFDRYTVPLALVLVLLSGIGPVIAWRKATAANARRNFLLPTAVALGTGVVLVALGAGSRPLALAMFVFGTFVFASVGQEFWRGIGVRRAMTGENPLAALRSLVSRNRRRYGGYLVHVGMAVLFIGVAASTAFNDARDIRLSPGQTSQVGDYAFTYVKPTSHISVDERRAAGEDLVRRRSCRCAATASSSRRCVPSAATTRRATRLGSDRALLRRRGDERDRPEGRPARRRLGRDDARQGRARAGRSSRATRSSRPRAASSRRRSRRSYSGRRCAGSPRATSRASPTATFRLITSPLVTWIWLGAIIVFLGALIAMWPGERDALRRRVRAGYAARVARDLGRAGPRGAQTVAAAGPPDAPA